MIQVILQGLNLLIAHVNAYPWNSANDPSLLDLRHQYQYRISELPSKGSIETPPWSETYWATYLGSINYRWNATSPSGYGYISPTLKEAQKMSDAELRQLAPSEKFDLYLGRYDYPLVREARLYSNPHAKVWSGICDGWSIAAIQFKEPHSVTLMNPDGIAVPFGSSDIKGLLSYIAAIHFNADSRQVGLKCGYWPFSSGCSDINAGSLHVIFTNQIGIQKKPFVIEIDSGRPIWNQPAFSYDFRLMASANSISTGRGIQVQAHLRYTDELDQSRWDPVVGTEAFQSGELELNYILDLNENDEIVGGTWLSPSDRPDFAWMPTHTLTFNDEFEGMNKILDAAGLPRLQ